MRSEHTEVTFSPLPQPIKAGMWLTTLYKRLYLSYNTNLLLLRPTYSLAWIDGCVCVTVVQTRAGRLLGVVGTDVPLKEITKLTPQYKVERWYCQEFVRPDRGDTKLGLNENNSPLRNDTKYIQAYVATMI